MMMPLTSADIPVEGRDRRATPHTAMAMDTHVSHEAFSLKSRNMSRETKTG